MVMIKNQETLKLPDDVWDHILEEQEAAFNG